MCQCSRLTVLGLPVQREAAGVSGASRTASSNTFMKSAVTRVQRLRARVLQPAKRERSQAHLACAAVEHVAIKP
jgi:hypothetical protein